MTDKLKQIGVGGLIMTSAALCEVPIWSTRLYGRYKELAKFGGELDIGIKTLRTRYMSLRTQFNISSPKQLGTVL